MSDYKDVTVSKDGKQYITGATASDYNDGSQILVTGGTVVTAPVQNECYLITSAEGPLDTDGIYQSGTAPYVFSNVE